MQKATSMLLEGEAKRLLRDAGITVPHWIEATDPADAGRQAGQLRFPVVAKAMVRGVAHKSEIDGVHIGLEDAVAVKAAAERIVSSVTTHLGPDRLHGVLVEEMAGPGTELLVGSSDDPVFGTLLAFGIGGIFTETLKDVAFRAIPLAPWDPYEMAAELRAEPLLAGARGKPPVDLDALAHLLMVLGGPDGLLTRGVIESVELNPVIATVEALVAVDAVIERKDDR